MTDADAQRVVKLLVALGYIGVKYEDPTMDADLLLRDMDEDLMEAIKQEDPSLVIDFRVPVEGDWEN